MNRETEITISRAGERRTVRIDLRTRKPKYKSNPYSEPRSVAASILGKSIANLKVSIFPGYIGIDFANEVSAAFDSTFQSADGLLIDLRGNPGGGIGGLRIMSYLSPGNRTAGRLLYRDPASRSGMNTPWRFLWRRIQVGTVSREQLGESVTWIAALIG